MALLAALAGYGSLDAQAPGAPAAPTQPLAASPIGSIDAPTAEALIGPKAHIEGWALASSGIRSVEVREGERRWPAKIGLDRPDVAAVRPGYRDNPRGGFVFDHDFTAERAPPGWDRRTLSIVAIANDGRETVLGTRALVEREALSRWPALSAASQPFYLLPALSGVAIGDASGLDWVYAPYLSRTLRIGMRVPILYLRTTRGAAADYAFDPNWDIERRCGERRIADDALAPVLAHAERKRLPVLVTLNGGIWADASCDAPQWDVNDRLEQDRANCQWNEKNEVMPDDWLRNLPGSQQSPELARALTLNVYATDVRRYKKRNLQQAARVIAAFARHHPDLLVGVNLDPDVYVNPFFNERQWYDYNPGTLRQFREWLAGTGPYGGKRERGVPDLRAYRREHPLTLAEVRAISGRAFASWSEVEPPRAFPRDGERPFWRDPWVREWEFFRRHLVKLHYDELARWTAEAGIAPDRIWTSQGFMAPDAGAIPFALHLASPVANYDSGGASVEGARPRIGHLGAILYGPSATNTTRMEDSASLFAEFEALDDGWGAVELNTADLRRPAEIPGDAPAYRTLRDLWNYDARLVSPMAWNGSNGIYAGKPGYVPYTAWRNTPFEEAAKDFLLAHANLPRGSRLWTFGNPRHADDDGWRATRGAMHAQRASLRVAPADGALQLESPGELRLRAGGRYRLVVLIDGASASNAKVWTRGLRDRDWRLAGQGDARHGIALSPSAERVDRVRIELRSSAPEATITRIAMVPLWR